mgnify:CR=1 FL=1
MKYIARLCIFIMCLLFTGCSEETQFEKLIIALEERNWKDAAIMLNEFLCTHDHVLLHTLNGLVHEHLGMSYEDYLNDAKNAYLKVLQSEPGNIPVQISLARIHVLLQEYEEAYTILHPLLQKDIKNVDIAYAISFILYRQKQYEEALKILLPAITLAPSFPTLHSLAHNIYTELNYTIYANHHAWEYKILTKNEK